MHSQFVIPSFNPSLSSSRKQQFYSPDPPPSTKHNFNKKLFEPEVVELFTHQQHKSKPRFSEEFWEALYFEQNKTYKTIINKYTLLQESIKLHRQALTLRNEQFIDNEDRITQLTKRIKALTDRAKQNDEKITSISLKCQEMKSAIEGTRSKIHKEQSVIIEQEKHIDDLDGRIESMRAEMKEIQKQLVDAIEREKQYDCIVDENQKLLLTLNKMKSEANFAKIKIDRDWNEEQNIVRKMKQLEKIIKFKQKNNRELGKKLIQLKKLNPEAANMTQNQKNNEKHSKAMEIIKNIKEMEEQYGKIQQQIYEISQKIYMLSDKMEQKIKAIQIMKMKQKKPTGEPQQFDTRPEHNQKKNNLSEDSKFQTNVQLETNQQSLLNPGFFKKTRAYKVIQSEENERYVYPKNTAKNETNQNQMSKKLKKSQISENQVRDESVRTGSQDKISHSRQRSENSKQETDENALEIDENLRKLVMKFHNYKSKSLFKH